MAGTDTNHRLSVSARYDSASGLEIPAPKAANTAFAGTPFAAGLDSANATNKPYSTDPKSMSLVLGYKPVPQLELSAHAGHSVNSDDTYLPSTYKFGGGATGILTNGIIGLSLGLRYNYNQAYGSLNAYGATNTVSTQAGFHSFDIVAGIPLTIKRFETTLELGGQYVTSIHHNNEYHIPGQILFLVSFKVGFCAIQ